MTKKHIAGLTLALLSAPLLLAAADGAWLRRVPPADHARVNPLVTTPESQEKAAGAGAQIFQNECAKCHGTNGAGLHSRPPIISDRVAHTTDGDLFWLMTNGNPWKGMPPWGMLPGTQRWQLVTYLRALNPTDEPTAPSPAPPQGVSH